MICIYIFISQAGSLRHYSTVGCWTLQKQRSTFDRCHVRCYGEKTLESEPLANSGAIWCPKGVAHVFCEYLYIYMYIHILITIYNIYIYDMYMIQSPYKWGHSFSIIHAARAKARLMALCCHDGGFLRKVTDPLMDEYMICLCRYWSTHIYIYIYMQGPPQGLPSKSF